LKWEIKSTYGTVSGKKFCKGENSSWLSLPYFLQELDAAGMAAHSIYSVAEIIVGLIKRKERGI
jgi:hypothetical protein